MFRGVKITRDPDVDGIVNAVSSRLQEIAREGETYNSSSFNQTEVRHVTFEEALKELINFKNSK
jgi:hypothetical protein